VFASNLDSRLSIEFIRPIMRSPLATLCCTRTLESIYSKRKFRNYQLNSLPKAMSSLHSNTGEPALMTVRISFDVYTLHKIHSIQRTIGITLSPPWIFTKPIRFPRPLPPEHEQHYINILEEFSYQPPIASYPAFPYLYKAKGGSQEMHLASLIPQELRGTISQLLRLQVDIQQKELGTEQH
jgi:hypothetical protein